MTNPHAHTMQHCREVIKACLNIVEERGDTYVAIHKDEDTECVVLVSMIRSYRIMSVIVADKILFAKEHEADMYRSANELNSESIAGWHTLVLTDSNSIYIHDGWRADWHHALCTAAYASGRCGCRANLAAYLC